ncbi:MAG: hypothetical protein L0211_18945 [Planctomycetaceae bacterium]|nr:hypothetical protein [Planctomycetaceae bacterium]
MRSFRPSALVLVAALTLSGVARSVAVGQANWEYSPYQVRVWIVAEPHPQCPAAIQSDLARRLSARAQAVCGAVWDLAVEPAPPGFVAALPDELNLPAAQFQKLSPDVLKGDKLLVVRLVPGSLGWEVEAREFDCHGWQWGPLIRRSASSTAELSLAIWDAAIEAFVPLARIETVDGPSVVARLRAGGLVVRSNSPVLMDKGSILQPIIRRNDRAGVPLPNTGIQPLAWTLLAVESRADALVQCKLHSGYRAALSSRASPRSERLALAVKPHYPATTLELRSRTAPQRLLTGYEIYAKRPDKEEVVHLGSSDWRGQIALPKGDGSLELLLIRNGAQLLARLPIVAGQDEHLVADLMDDDGRLQAEGAVAALHSRVLDLVARREILASRFRARLKEGKLDEAQALLDQFRLLESRADLSRSFDEMQKAVAASDRLTQQRIGKLFDDARKLLTVKGLSDDMVNTLVAELTRARAAPRTTPTSAPTAK